LHDKYHRPIEVGDTVLIEATVTSVQEDVVETAMPVSGLKVGGPPAYLYGCHKPEDLTLLVLAEFRQEDEILGVGV
jgi:hypothetical protein